MFTWGLATGYHGEMGNLSNITRKSLEEYMKTWTAILAILGLVAGLALAGCQTKAQQGAGLGALGGGLVGSLVGPSKNREQNALIGAAIGGLLGYTIGNEMDKNDLQRVNRAYETMPDHQTTRWVNPNSGNSYAVTPQETHEIDGRPCRKAVIEAMVDGKRERVTKTACRRSDGTWEI